MYIKITAKRWFQKTYGNTYHSCLVEKCTGTGNDYKREVIGYEPFSYGYDRSYLSTTAKILGMDEGILREDIRNHPEHFCIFCTDVTRKKDL